MLLPVWRVLLGHTLRHIQQKTQSWNDTEAHISGPFPNRIVSMAAGETVEAVNILILEFPHYLMDKNTTLQ